MIFEIVLCSIAISTAQANVCMTGGNTTTVRGITGVACTTNLLWKDNIVCRVNGVNNQAAALGTGGLSLMALPNENDDTTRANVRANALSIYGVILKEMNLVWSQISASTGAMQAYLVRWETLLNAVGPGLLGVDWETVPACGLNGVTSPSITCGTLHINSTRVGSAYVRCT
ncbi:hypothetical protein HDE_14320 [Halotydeus destructor]|nr:hypothetical protein HDE_14320 [Halotydeus destructor]